MVAVTGLFLLSTPAASGDPAGGATGSDHSVEQARAELARASQARAAAEARLADARVRKQSAEAELEELSGDAASITEDLADARSRVREYAVAAYIDGGASALAAAALTPTERAEVAWHSQLVGSTTADAAEAIDHYRALEALNEPARVTAATRLDALGEEVTAAFNDAVQAAAHERDAEALLARATAAAAERAAREANRQAAARAAEQAEAAAPSQSPESTATVRATGSPDGAGGPSNGAGGPAGGGSAPTPPSSAPTPPSSAPGVSTPTAAEAATLARIRHCESGGNYGIVSASGRYRGAYQFDRRTWSSMGGSGDPAAASPAEQDLRALMLLRQRGTRPWPHCG